MRPSEKNPRRNDPNWYYYPKGGGSWHWVGDYDPNDPRHEDENWAYLPELGGWIWIGPDEADPTEETCAPARTTFNLFSYDIALRLIIITIGLVFVVTLFVL